MPGQEEMEDEDQGMVDPNDVELIDDGEDFGEEMDDDESQPSRNLNRQTENMADFNKRGGKKRDQMHEVENDGMYDDDIVNEQNSSNFQM